MGKKRVFICIFALILLASASLPALANMDEQDFVDMFGTIKETVQPREIDKQAAQLSKEYAAGKNLPALTRGRDGSVQYVFSTTIPRILCRPLRVTDIALEPGEKITNAPFIGDSINWTVLPSLSGAGSDTTYHLIIKPSMPDIVTNLIVHTDRRTYHFDLVSSKEMYTPYVSFVYPQEVNATWTDFFEQVQRSAPAQEGPVLPAKRGQGAKSTLNYNYKITAKNKDIAWEPLAVYDDGHKTYIEFPEILSSVEAPVFFITVGGKREIVNYRKYGDTYIVDRLFDSGVLIAGTGKIAKTVNIARSTEPVKTPEAKASPVAPAPAARQKPAAKEQPQIEATDPTPVEPVAPQKAQEEKARADQLWNTLRADVALYELEQEEEQVTATEEPVIEESVVSESVETEAPVEPLSIEEWQKNMEKPRAVEDEPQPEEKSGKDTYTFQDYVDSTNSKGPFGVFGILDILK